MVEACWREIPVYFPRVCNPVFVVVSNRFHGIIEIGGARHALPVRGRMLPNSLGAIIGSFKLAVSRNFYQMPGYENVQNVQNVQI